MQGLIIANSVIGNINKDKKLHEEYQVFCQKGLCEKIMVSRLESQRVRMRKTTEKGTDIGLVLAQGMVLKNGDVVYLTEEKIIIVEIEPESVAVLSFKSDDSRGHDLFALAVRIGHSLGNLHRPIKVVGETIYVPIQADTEIDLLKKIFEPLQHHLDIAKDQIVFEPEEGMQTHEHK
jgi:urease accessory protein